MRTLLESITEAEKDPSSQHQDFPENPMHETGDSASNTIHDFVSEMKKQIHEEGLGHAHHSHTHQYDPGDVPVKSLVEYHEEELPRVRGIEEVLRDVPDTVEVSPKAFIYVIVITMVIVLLLVLLFFWLYHYLDDGKKSKRKDKSEDGNFQQIKQRHSYDGYDSQSPSGVWKKNMLHQRRQHGTSSTAFAYDSAPLGLPRPHGSAEQAGPHQLGTAVTAAARQLQEVVADSTKWINVTDTATKVATTMTQSVLQHSGLGFGSGASGAAPMPPQQQTAGYSAGLHKGQQANPVFIPPPPINPTPAGFQPQQQNISGANYPPHSGHSGHSSDSSDSSSSRGHREAQFVFPKNSGRPMSSRNTPTETSQNSASPGAASAGIPPIIRQANGAGDSGGSAIFGGLRGSGPLINVLRANANVSGTSTMDSNQSPVDMAGVIAQYPPPAAPPEQESKPKTAPLSFLPLQDGLVSQEEKESVLNRVTNSDADSAMLSALPSLQIGELALDSVLGGGAFGQVWKGTWRGTPVAVKVLSGPLQRVNMPAAELKAFIDEVSMLSRLRHPNICLFMGVCIEPPNRAIVTELVSRGSLWDVLRTPNIFNENSNIDPNFESCWPSWAIRKVLDGTCKGLLYLHSNTPSPIIHRDLKSANILLDDSFNVKICDFGLARLRDFSVQMTANVGTVQWMAPEVLLGKNYAESADIYSLGMIAWELITAKCPFEGLAQMEIAIQVTQQVLRPPIPVYCSPAQRALLLRCWAGNPSDRLTAEQALKAIDDAFPNV